MPASDAPTGGSRRLSVRPHAVADAEYRLNILRLRGVGFDLAAQVLDVRVECAFERLVIVTECSLDQLAAREGVVGALQQRAQQRELGWRQVEWTLLDSGGMLRAVQAQPAYLQDGR